MAQFHTPTKASKEKPEKQIALGYVTYLSPKSGCSVGGRPQFDIHFQNTDTSLIKAKGFGDDNYNKLTSFAKDKSPVKMQLFTTTKYPTPTCGYHSNIKKATRVEVPFDWNEKLELEEKGASSSVRVSTVASIAEILAESDLKKLYTVIGKLHKGTEPEKRNQGNRIKEDNVLFQQNDKLRMTIWNDYIDQVENGMCYSFTNVKLADFDGPHLTTSRWTTITSSDADENIVIPDNFTIKDDFNSIVVEDIGKVSVPDIFCACGKCKSKVMESNIRKKAYTCVNCQGSHFNPLLVKDCFTIDVEVKSDGARKVLTLIKDVASKTYDIANPQEVADELGDLIGCTIEYHMKNNQIHSIKRPEQDVNPENEGTDENVERPEENLIPENEDTEENVKRPEEDLIMENEDTDENVDLL